MGVRLGREGGNSLTNASPRSACPPPLVTGGGCQGVNHGEGVNGSTTSMAEEPSNFQLPCWSPACLTPHSPHSASQGPAGSCPHPFAASGEGRSVWRGWAATSTRGHGSLEPSCCRGDTGCALAALMGFSTCPLGGSCGELIGLEERCWQRSIQDV